MKFILGKKLGMSQLFNKERKIVPITLIEAEPCEVLDIRTEEKNGYEAIQIGAGKISPKKIKKSQKEKPFKYLKEFKEDISKLKIGDKISVSIFQEGDKVKISGISKGKGFQGGVKRWGFSGRDATHGVKHEHRTLGSVGCSYPERVIKGRKMPGRMGSERVTVKNLKVVKVDEENSLLAVKGAVPGRNGTLLEIRGE
jgi:large subunit ribosomal protein L3